MKKYPGVKVGPTIPATISKVGVHPNPRKDIHSWNVHTVPDSQGSATYYSLKSYRTKDAK
jgi:hypothetical protein